MKRKFKEKLSIMISKNPGGVIVMAILLFNIMFFLLSAFVIRNMSLSGTEKMGFFEAAFCTITMILDAGCIQFVVADIGESGILIALVCLCIIITGMVSFTGAVIGYVTNYISNFIDSSDAGNRKMVLSDHIVILNWNTRASEIVNDLLYCKKKQKVVVLAESGKDEIEKEIEERLSDTIRRENAELKAHYSSLGKIKGYFKYLTEKIQNNVIVIVREGNVYSSKQLHDISLEKAKSVIILGADINNTVCKYEHTEKIQENSRGNALTIKTLMQVADITSAQDSDDNQKIIVEISDEWTQDVVDKIIAYKQVKGKCNIVPVRINQILGQILSQFSLMPELNLAYKELFSNKGVAFYAKEQRVFDDNSFITSYLKNHCNAIPLSSLETDEKTYFYYAAVAQKDIDIPRYVDSSYYKVKLNQNYWIEKKNVIILGHNSKCKDIMQGFCDFRNEWNYKDSFDDILQIIVIDDPKSLERMNYYKEYPFVIETVSASIYDKDLICSAIERLVSTNKEDTSILILSDDTAFNDNIDANALANLVYVQAIINEKKHEDPKFDPESIDIIVEIIDPKHHDIVSSYSVDNIVISNRYISKMITQIGEKESIFNFYTDILTYDAEDAIEYESKEIYIKKVSDFFAELPGECTATEFIRAVWEASIDKSIPEKRRNPTVALGYVKHGGKIVLFEGDQSSIQVKLDKEDKIIVFTNH